MCDVISVCSVRWPDANAQSRWGRTNEKEREGKRERESEREIERERNRKIEREKQRDREREREREIDRTLGCKIQKTKKHPQPPYHPQGGLIGIYRLKC